jgi:SPP1 gp7 family putative phage head morphogenesis protein
MGILLDSFSLSPAAAVEYLRKKKLRISGAWYTVWKEQHTQVFTVANLARLDLLQSIRDMVNKAVDGEYTTDSNGDRIKRAITFQQFKKELIPQLKKAGWWGIEEITDAEGNVIERQLGSVPRLRTIYRTNVQTALNAGRYKSQMETAADLPYLEYIIIYDGATTNRCRGLRNKIFAANDPVLDYIYPPNHWHCRSRMRSLTRSQVERGDTPVENTAGSIIERQVEIGSGDKIRTVPVNGYKYIGEDGMPHEFIPDAGWDYNPGKASFKADLKKYDSDIASLYDGGSE